MKAINGLGHAAVVVKDVERSLAFYTQVLEFSEMDRLYRDDGRLLGIYLRITDTQYLEIFPDDIPFFSSAARNWTTGPSANGLHHFCLTVDRLEPVLDAVAANGGAYYAWVDSGDGLVLAPASEPGITIGLDGNRQAWLADPDGNRIELMEMAPNGMQLRAIRRLQAERAKASA